MSRVADPNAWDNKCSKHKLVGSHSSRSRSLLFISFKKGHTSDIRPTTLSSWLKQTILLCYKEADQQALDLVQVKVHDIRAFVASKAFYGGVSVDQIMQACHWKAHNTFTNFYLKDLTWSDNNNNMYLGGSGTTSPRPFPSDQLSSERKQRGNTCYNQVYRSLIPGFRYMFTSSGCWVIFIYVYLHNL